MNILFINSIDKVGGAARVAWSIKNSLDKLGHKTSMYTGHKVSSDKSVFIDDNKKLFKIPDKKGLRTFNFFFDLLLGNNLKTEKIIRNLLANDLNYFGTEFIFDKEEYKKADIVHYHNLHSNFFDLRTLQRMSKEKPIVWTLHDMWALTGHCVHSLDCDEWKTGCNKCSNLSLDQALLWDNSKRLWREKKKIYQNSKLNIVVPSFWLKEKIDKSILKDQAISQIPNGINTKIFRKYDKFETRRKLGLPFDKRIIIFLAHGGKNNFWKGWQYAKQVARSLRQEKKIIFLCIGDDDVKNSGSEYKNIKFLGRINSSKAIAQYYSAGDVFMMSSIAENFPLTVLESMSCGLPVVSFDVGGVKEAVLNKKTGYITRNKSAKDLVGGIRYILDLNKDEYSQLSADAVKRVKDNYSLAKMVSRYLALYNQLIKDKK